MMELTSWQAQASYLVAIQYGDVEQCAKLLAAGADADQTFKINSVMRPALCLGVERGAYALVELLLKSGVGVNRRDSKGSTPLHVAVEMNYDSIVELLLNNRADVNAGDDELVTPLHVAAKRGAIGIIGSLVTHGCDINKKDCSGKTALHYACEMPNVSREVIQMLLNAGAVPDEPDYSGTTPLMCLLSTPTFEYQAMKLFVEKCVQLNLVTPDGNNPVHVVILSNNVDKWKCLKLLLSNGCDKDATNHMGQSPVHLACLMSDIESLRILIRANANPNTVDRLGISPLGYCICNGFASFAHLLIDGGAKENLSRLSLYRLKPSFQSDLRQRFSNVGSLKELSRRSLKDHLECDYEEWISQNKNQLPVTLIPFMMFLEGDYH